MSREPNEGSPLCRDAHLEAVPGGQGLPAADRQGPRYPCSHQLQLRVAGCLCRAVIKRGYCSPNNIAVTEEQIREL